MAKANEVIKDITYSLKIRLVFRIGKIGKKKPSWLGGNVGGVMSS